MAEYTREMHLTNTVCSKKYSFIEAVTNLNGVSDCDSALPFCGHSVLGGWPRQEGLQIYLHLSCWLSFRQKPSAEERSKQLEQKRQQRAQMQESIVMEIDKEWEDMLQEVAVSTASKKSLPAAKPTTSPASRTVAITSSTTMPSTAKDSQVTGLPQAQVVRCSIWSLFETSTGVFVWWFLYILHLWVGKKKKNQKCLSQNLSSDISKIPRLPGPHWPSANTS